MNWHRMPNAVTERIAEMGLAAYAVYGVLSKHANQQGVAWPSVDTIATTCGITRATAYRALRTLKAAGFIVADRRQDEKGRDMSTRYTLPPVGESVTRSLPVVLSRHGEGVTRDTGRVSPEYYEQDPLEQEPIERESSRPKLRFAEADMATAEWMISKIRAFDPKAKASLPSWANSIRLMRERDHRTDEEIRAVFSWANADSFWRSNILSPDKLREKFTTLALKSKEGSINGNGKYRQPRQLGPGQRHEDDIRDAEGTM